MNRSVKQNRYYWKICINEAIKGLLDAGHEPETLDPDGVHEFFKGMFLTRLADVNEEGRRIELNATTRKLTTKEFMDYTGHIQRWAAIWLDIQIPDPNQVKEESTELKETT